MRIAAVLPRIIFSPILSDKITSEPKENILQTWRLLASPVNQKDTNTVQVEWTNMSAEPEFVLTYYIKELQKANYIIDRGSYSNAIDFKNADGVTGNLVVSDPLAGKGGTQAAILTVNYAQ